MKNVIRLSLLLIIGWPSLSMGQELPSEPISKWITSDVIFWHKDLPYFVSISDDSTNSGTLLKSSKQAKYSNPAYFDTYGWNFIRTKWAVDKKTHNKAVPQQEIEWPVFVDGEPPTTKPSFKSKSAYLVDGVRYFTKDLIMELSSNDKHSGVRSTYYSVNDSTYIKYIDPLNLNPRDTFKVKYFSVDNVGNYEKLKTFAYNADDYNIKYAIDAYPPVTKLVTKLLKGNYLGPNMPIEFKSKDKGTGVAFTNYTVDGGELKVYEKPSNLNLPEGPHILKYFSVDKITNKEEENILNFMVDNTGPNMFIAADGYFSRDSIMYVSDSTKIRLSINDKRGVKRVAYKFTNDKGYKIYSGPVTLDKSMSSRQDLRYFATDSADNDSEVHVIKLHRDTSPPKINLVISGQQYTRKDTTYVTEKSILKRNNYDTLSGIELDKMYVNGSDTEILTFENELIYSVENLVIDNIGNLAKVLKIYKGDGRSPEINWTFSAPHQQDKSVYPQGTILFFSITDKTGVESFKITVNGKQLMEAAFAPGVGDYEVQITAVDYLKQSSMRLITFSIR